MRAWGIGTDLGQCSQPARGQNVELISGSWRPAPAAKPHFSRDGMSWQRPGTILHVKLLPNPNPSPQTERLALLSNLLLLQFLSHPLAAKSSGGEVVPDFSVPKKIGTVYSTGGSSLGSAEGKRCGFMCMCVASSWLFTEQNQNPPPPPQHTYFYLPNYSA